jgi:AraC-like DNA-binding protein
MPPALAHYREFAPCEALRDCVRAFFSFAHHVHEPAPRPFLYEVTFDEDTTPFAPFLADGHVSLAFTFEGMYTSGRGWDRALSSPGADAIGPMTAVCGFSLGQCQESVGVFLRAGHAGLITGAPPALLADRVVALEDLWGPASAGLLAQLAAAGESARIDRFESALLRRLANAPSHNHALDVPSLARSILRAQGRLRIEPLAFAAGVSRQHLTRSFRESVGVPPKLFARLARFRAGLAYAGCGPNIDWAQTAFDLGYADQSHMIADFREFAGLTPEALARRRWFHPFIELAVRRARPSTVTHISRGAVAPARTCALH